MMHVLLWVLVALIILAALVIVFFLWWSSAVVMRPYRNKPTVHAYQQVGDVYRDRGGFEWEVVAPGRLRLLGSLNALSQSASAVAEAHGPLVYVHREEATP